MLVPAIPLAAQESGQAADEAAPPTLTPSNVSPAAALSSDQADGKVTFDASASSDPDGTIAAYDWDLDGDGVYETKTGTEPRTSRDYPAGTTLVAAVRVVDDAGASDDATAAVVVASAPVEQDPAPAPASASDAPLVPTSQLPAEPAAEPRAVRSSREDSDDEADAAPAKEATVRAAANGAVTIRDFEFAPTTTTVNVGDSVTWLNQGPTVHTASANDGSFESGNLAKGKSFSHKFTKAGTFSYFCKPHPFMTAKVVVKAGGSGSSGSGSSGAGSGSDSGSGDTAGATGSDAGTSGSGSSGDLAQTGVDLLPWALFGFSLLAFGASLRYRLTD